MNGSARQGEGRLGRQKEDVRAGCVWRRAGWSLGIGGRWEELSPVSKYLPRTPRCGAVPELGDKSRMSCLSQAVAVKMERRPWTWGTLWRANCWDLINWI